MKWIQAICRALRPQAALARSTTHGQVTFDLAPLVEAAKALNMRKENARIVVYLDRSHSTEDRHGSFGGNRLYSDGTMQLLISIVVSATLGGFSTTGSAALRFFHEHVVTPAWPADGNVTRRNVNRILERNKQLKFGGTRFIPVLLDLARQALLLEAASDPAYTPAMLESYRQKIVSMSDKKVLKLIKPQPGRPLQRRQRLPQPILGVIGTDGLAAETLLELMEVACWLSQYGVYILFVGMGNYDFALLKQLDKVGEDLFLKKGLKPLWDNVDFVDIKDLTGGKHSIPDGPQTLRLLLGRFMDNAYPACRQIGLIP